MQARVSTIPQDVVMARDIFASSAPSKFSEAIGTPVGFVEQILHLAKVCTSQVSCVVEKSGLYGQHLTSDGAAIVSLRPAPPSPEINVGITILIFLCLEGPPLNSLATLILMGRGGTHTAI